MQTAKIVSAPGRICLFGEHSDYLGLPVMTMAINLRLEIQATPRRDKKFFISMPDVEDEDSFTPSDLLTYEKPRDYLRSAVNVLKRLGYRFPQGYDFVIRSQIPIYSGTSSSSALVVAWLKMLLSFQPDYVQFNPMKMAQLAFETEVAEFKEAGGRMDHVAISFGRTLFQENHGNLDIRFIRKPLAGMILGDSLEKKETVESLKKNKSDVLAGFEHVKEQIKNFDVERTPVKEVLKKFSPTTEPIRKAIGTLVNRDICRQAGGILTTGPSFSPEKVGQLMNRHHLILKRDLHISTPKIERMIDAALQAGALGAKINGSGLGGTMIAYAPGKEKAVMRMIEKEGEKVYLVQQDRGVV